MDGVGRTTNNAFIERLWRSIKYEKLYLMPTTDGRHLYHLLNDYFRYYNYKRRHSGINDYYPAGLYYNKIKVGV